MFQPFIVTNEGNVNALNVRLAKGTAVNGGAFNPWPIFGAGTDSMGYLDGSLFLFSDLDRNSVSNYAAGDSGSSGLPGGFRLTPQTPLQKPRVGDPSGTSLSTNPIARPNPNLNIAQLTPFFPNTTAFPIQSPRVAVSLPLGFPVGSYSTVLRVIEDDNDNEALDLDSNLNGLEPYSDPTLTLKFLAREVRLTSTTTKQARPAGGAITPTNPLLGMTSALLDDLEPYTGPASKYEYGNTTPAGLRLNGDGTLDHGLGL